MGSPHGTPTRYSIGCRCSECRAAKNLVNLVYSRAKSRAVRRFRDRNPGEWDRFLDEEYERVGLDRNPVGRPASDDSTWRMESY